jgi:putative flippase GtrA
MCAPLLRARACKPFAAKFFRVLRFSRHTMTAIPSVRVPAPASIVEQLNETLRSAPPDATAAQLGRYTIVGGIAFVADFSTLYACTELLRLHYLASGAIALLVGIAINYALSVRFVFRVRRVRHRGLELLIFALIGFVGLALNEGLLYLFTQLGGLHYLLSKVAATAVTYLWNFFARKRSLFTSR